jgi:hypothetical protein
MGHSRRVLRLAFALAITSAIAHSHTASADSTGAPERPTSRDIPAIPNGRALRDPDVDGFGVLAIARAQEAAVDATFTHEDGRDALAVVPRVRLAIGAHAFFEGQLPVGWGKQANAFALGNVTVSGGLLPATSRLVAIALRISAPTSPSVGAGMMTAAALATPRIADPELFLVHTTAAELVADWRWRGDASWVQVETGAAAWWTPAEYETVLRASVAGGVRVDTWLDLSASFVTRSFLLVRHAPEDFVHALTLGIIAHHRRGQLAVRLEVPIDAAARDDNRFLVGLELRGR